MGLRYREGRAEPFQVTCAEAVLRSHSGEGSQGGSAFRVQDGVGLEGKYPAASSPEPGPPCSGWVLPASSPWLPTPAHLSL